MIDNTIYDNTTESMIKGFFAEKLEYFTWYNAIKGECHVI